MLSTLLLLHNKLHMYILGHCQIYTVKYSYMFDNTTIVSTSSDICKNVMYLS